MFHVKKFALLCLVLASYSLPLSAQTAETVSQGIDKLKNSLQSSQLSDDARNAINEQLEQANAELAARKNFNSQLNQYEQAVLQAKDRLASLRQEQQQVASQTPTIDPNASAQELENQLMVLTARQSSLQSQIDSLVQQKATLNNRPIAISEELRNSREALDTTLEALSQVSTQNDEPGARATRLALQAKRLSSEAQISLLEHEGATIPARLSLVDGHLSLLNTQYNTLKQQIELGQKQLANRRARQAAKVLATARQYVEQSQDSAYLQEKANNVLDLANQLNELATDSPKLNNNIAHLRQQRQNLQQSAQTVDSVLLTGQITDELGVLLHRLRAGLPQEQPLTNRLEQIDEQTVHLQLNLILWQDKLRETSDNPASNTTANANIGSEEPDQLSEAQLALLAEITQSEQQLLTLLLDAANEMLDQLGAEKLVLSEVKSKTKELKTLLDRRLIWLPSYTRLSDNVLHNLAMSIDWYANPAAWWQVGKDFWQGVVKLPLLSIAVLFIASAIFFLRPILKSSLLRLTKQVGNVGRDTYWATPLALLETLILALPLPLLIGATAGLITIGSGTGRFSLAIATALAAVSSLSLTLLFFRSLCRRNGIFAGHFGWSNAAREKLGHVLTLFVWYQGVATLVFASAMASNQLELRYGIAIVAFIAMSVGIALFNLAFFKPKSGIAASIVGRNNRTLLSGAVFFFMVSAPLLIGLLPLIGFFDTAVELQTRLFQSCVVLIFVAIFYGILLRMFAVAYRRYLLSKTKIRRAKQEQQRAQQQLNEATGDAVPIAPSYELPDNQQAMVKMRRTAFWIAASLFVTGLWLIWLPLLPALGIVNEIVLWHKTVQIDGIAVSEGVTLWNIIVSVALIIGGFIGAGNAKNILELSYFQRVSLDAGARYAAVTIFSYVILGVSVIIGLSQLGIDWSKLQWIVAALGVGLGFGLQEIVANFVSGLIILFERPVRVGDTVTIGNLSGTVSNIKIRATTITDFENREVLLPNKSIITENVINWTLGNATTRILLKIGVAYGSDTRKVRELLMQVLENHPDVLSHPAPSVFFINHGESSLDFELRIFVDAPSKRLPVTHEINTLINEALTREGYEIPFPQRDIHIIGDIAHKAINPEEPKLEQQ